MFQTLRELMDEQTPELRAEVARRKEAYRREMALSELREALELSQTEMARIMGVRQPTLARIEQPENDPRLSTLKRYVDALGGELSIDVRLPGGKRVAFEL